MSEPVRTHCVNCGNEYIGDFCHFCGQKKLVNRLTFRNAWLEFQQFFLGFDTKFFRTFKTVWVNPGRVAQANIDGNRVLFVGPVGYLFLVLTLLVLLIGIFDVNWLELMSESIETFAAGEQQQQTALQQELLESIFNNFRSFQFLVIPFMALAAKLFFRKTGYNYLEHMVLVFYVQAQMVWITILNVLSHVIFDKTYFFLSFPISFLFYGFSCASFYPGKSKLKRFIKGMFVQIVGMTFFILVFTLVAVGVILLIAVINPELMEKLAKPA